MSLLDEPQVIESEYLLSLLRPLIENLEVKLTNHIIDTDRRIRHLENRIIDLQNMVDRIDIRLKDQENRKYILTEVQDHSDRSYY